MLCKLIKNICSKIKTQQDEYELVFIEEFSDY
jgi:hypothetical protein